MMMMTDEQRAENAYYIEVYRIFGCRKNNRLESHLRKSRRKVTSRNLGKNTLTKRYWNYHCNCTVHGWSIVVEGLFA